MDNILRSFFFSISAFHIAFSLKVFLYWEMKFFSYIYWSISNTARNIVKFFHCSFDLHSIFFFRHYCCAILIFLFCFFFWKKARMYHIIIDGDEERVIILYYERVYCHIVVPKTIVGRFFASIYWALSVSDSDDVNQKKKIGERK
jgi:hypothetical protein